MPNKILNLSNQKIQLFSAHFYSLFPHHFAVVLDQKFTTWKRSKPSLHNQPFPDNFFENAQPVPHLFGVGVHGEGQQRRGWLKHMKICPTSRKSFSVRDGPVHFLYAGGPLLASRPPKKRGATNHCIAVEVICVLVEGLQSPIWGAGPKGGGVDEGGVIIKMEGL